MFQWSLGYPGRTQPRWESLTEPLNGANGRVEGEGLGFGLVNKVLRRINSFFNRGIKGGIRPLVQL